MFGRSTILFFIVFSSLLHSCDSDKLSKTDRRLKIVNNHPNSVVVITSNSFPDTVNFQFNGCPVYDASVTVEPNSTEIYGIRMSWEERFRDRPSNTLMFFIYDIDSAMRYHTGDPKNTSNQDCDSLKKYLKPLRRFDANIDYLNAHNWTLVVP